MMNVCLIKFLKLRFLSRLLLILFHIFLLTSCGTVGLLYDVYTHKNQKNKSQKAATPIISKTADALNQYKRIHGDWRVRSILAPINRFDRAEREEHIQIHFSPEKAWMRVMGSVSGVVNLEYEGISSHNSHSHNSDLLIFSFKPFVVEHNFSESSPPILTTGKIQVRVYKSPYDKRYYLSKGINKGLSYQPVDSLSSPTYFDKFNSQKSPIEQKKQLLSTIKYLNKQGGYRCIAQQEYIIDSRKATGVRFPSYSGNMLILFYSPDAPDDLVFYTGGRYVPRMYGGIPSISDQFFRTGPAGGTAFEIFPGDPFSTISLPIRLKVLMFNNSWGAYSNMPCDNELQTPRFDKRWTGLAQIFLAIWADKKQGNLACDNSEVSTLLSTVSGVAKSNLMSNGIRNLAPNLSDSDIGYISRLALDIVGGDLQDIKYSPLRETVYQKVSDRFPDQNSHLIAAIADSLIDVYKLRKECE